jgi:metacaspase-1
MRHAALSLLTTAAVVFGPASGAGAEGRAVVVGIDYYPGVTQVRPLSQARSDAIRFRDHLIAGQGFAPEDVTLLTDEQATAGAIIDALVQELVAGTRPGDRAVFYFAGLGGRALDPDGTEADGYEEFLLAHGPNDAFARMPESAFIEIFDQIGDRDVSLVIDASMTAARASVVRDGDAVAPRGIEIGQVGPVSRTVTSEDLGPVGEITFMESPFATGRADRDIWTAAAPSQVAWESPEGGVLTAAWLDGVAAGAADMNGNGIVTNAELLVHLREAAEAWCEGVETCDATGLGLTPDFSGDVMGVAAMVAGQIAAIDGGSVPGAAPVAGTAVATPSPAAEIAASDNTLAFITDLFAASNDAGMSITMAPDRDLELGETVRFDIRSERAGTLLLLDVNPEGELFQIFPSTLSVRDAATIGAGESLSIPEAFATTGMPLQIRVTEPAGPGFLVALLVEGHVPAYERILPDHLNVEPIPNAVQYLYEIAQSLLEMQAGPDGNGSVNWSATYLPYRILD